MARKCRIYVCKGRAKIQGYCPVHYDRIITPPQSLTRTKLFRFMTSLEQALSAEFGMSLRKWMVPSSPEGLSKDELRDRYKMLRRLLDGRIVPKLRAQAKRGSFRPFAEPTWEAWEQLCLTVGRILYRDVLVHPILPNGQIPDIVPVLDGLRMENGPGGAIRVTFAPVIVDAKFSISSARKELVDYGPYCRELQIWFFRWKPHWLKRRSPTIIYLSGHELAEAVMQKGQPDLAKFLRGLPLLWNNFHDMAEIYGRGLDEV